MIDLIVKLTSNPVAVFLFLPSSPDTVRFEMEAAFFFDTIQAPSDFQANKRFEGRRWVLVEWEQSDGVLRCKGD